MPFRAALVLGLLALFFAVLIGVMIWAMVVQARYQARTGWPRPPRLPRGALSKGLALVVAWALAISASVELIRIVRTGVVLTRHRFVTLADDRGEFLLHVTLYGLGTLALVALAVGALALFRPIREVMRRAFMRLNGKRRPLSLQEARKASSARRARGSGSSD